MKYFLSNLLQIMRGGDYLHDYLHGQFYMSKPLLNQDFLFFLNISILFSTIRKQDRNLDDLHYLR